jgi:hypothetical protein
MSITMFTASSYIMALTAMDAVSAAIVASRQALIQLNIEVNKNILISTLIYLI